jgi:hypothetical protein
VWDGVDTTDVGIRNNRDSMGSGTGTGTGCAVVRGQSWGQQRGRGTKNVDPARFVPWPSLGRRVVPMLPSDPNVVLTPSIR